MRAWPSWPTRPSVRASPARSAGRPRPANGLPRGGVAQPRRLSTSVARARFLWAKPFAHGVSDRPREALAVRRLSATVVRTRLRRLRSATATPSTTFKSSNNCGMPIAWRGPRGSRQSAWPQRPVPSIRVVCRACRSVTKPSVRSQRSPQVLPPLVPSAPRRQMRHRRQS